MNRKILARISAGILFLLLASVAYVQSQNQPPKLTLNKVKDDLYEIEGDGGNVGVYITSEGVILVDDKYDQDHEGILAAVKQVTPLPVKYVISTHHHADHSGGNTKMYRLRCFWAARKCGRAITGAVIPMATRSSITRHCGHCRPAI